ncbi:MAG: ABC transporter permease [Candidatus Rokubacteria bacterium]|nr:ABC transporter permease [Candidatus Rokubacteria bacterium]
MRSSVETAAISTAAVLVALLLFGGFAAARGLDPLEVYRVLYVGAFGTWFAVQNTLTQAAPLMLTALCTAVPARAGLLVIGGEGALVIGGLATVLAGVPLAGAPAPLGIALLCAAGAVAGGLWVGAAGALRHWRGVNETISTLLLNYIAIAVLNHLITGPIRDFAQVLKPASWSLGEHLRIGDVPGTSVHWGLAFGVAACALLWVLMRRTTFGFAVDILGGNVRAARMAGLPVGAMVLVACFLGGAAAGLAGAVEVVAVHGFASSSLVVGYGYAGILVAFLARQNPLAIVFVSVLLGGISASGGLLQRRFGLPDAATLVLRGLLFVAVLASTTLYGRLRVFRRP